MVCRPSRADKAQLTGASSLSLSAWQMALSRVVVGSGIGGVQLLTIIILNGNSCPALPAVWNFANLRDFVRLYELPLWATATVASGALGLILGDPFAATLKAAPGFHW